ncbi:hypothetical protein C0995_011592 [Termitomyces sp. Mi166|nr:hypothetical protein C0995_011592 [Termitomyces sp. Mi166\
MRPDVELQVLFSVYQCHLWRLVSLPAPYGPGDLGEIQAAFKRLLKSGLVDLPADGGDEESQRPGSPEEDIVQLELNDPRAIDFRNALRPWFGNATWSSIKLHQVRQWVFWSIYNADMPPYESLTASQQDVMAGALDLLQKRCGCIFEEGSNPSVKTMRMTLDRANVILRPFTFYLSIFLTNLSLRKWFQYAWSVRFDHYNGLEFLTPMTRHETAKRLANLLIELGWVHHDLDDGNDTEEEKEIAHSLVGKRRKGVIMLSHSNGSYIHAWMLKGYHKMIGRSCFVDPVTFCSWEGEVGVVNLLARHFDWTSNTLWFEDIPNARDPKKAFFLLGGQDSIIRSERVKRYLTSHGVKEGLWFDPVGSHGQALRPETPGHLEILRWIREDRDF